MGTSSKADRQFDALILGCGSAGTTAAKRLRAGGQTVAVVEMDQPAGAAARSCTRTSLTTRAGWPLPTCSRARLCGRTTESSHASPSPSRPSLQSV